MYLLQMSQCDSATVSNHNKNWLQSFSLTSDSGEDLSTPAEIADSLNTYFQSVFVKEKTVDEGLPHFASRTCTSCNDDGETIFTLEALYQEIDKLKDNKAKGKRLVLSSWRDARLLYRNRCLLFSKRVSLKALFLISGS